MVSIIIPTKGRPSLHALIQSIEDSARQHSLVALHDYEVVVAMDLRSETQPLNLGTSVRLVTGQGPGVNQARNAGARASTGEILWFLDDDVELMGGNFHQTLNEIFASVDRIAAGGNYRSKEGAAFVERGYNAFCSLWRVSAGVEDAEQLLGGTLAVRKSDWERVGGFDDAIEYGGAETSFVLRLNRSLSRTPARVVADERLDVFHHPGSRSFESWKTLAGRQAQEKSKTEFGLPSPLVRGRRALKYLAKQEALTLLALMAFGLPYLAASKTAIRNRS